MVDFKAQNPDERFWSFVDKSGDCWLWTGAVNSGGYGSFFANGRIVGAHRYSLQMSGVELRDKCALHTCDTPACVNPAHLYAGTKKDNARDAVDRGLLWQRKRTHCPQGHAYTDENTIVWGNGFRKCRECNRTSARNRYRATHNVKQEAHRGI